MLSSPSDRNASFGPDRTPCARKVAVKRRRGPAVLTLDKAEAFGVTTGRHGLADDRHEMGVLVLPVAKIPAVDADDARHVLPRPPGSGDRLVLNVQITLTASGNTQRVPSHRRGTQLDIDRQEVTQGLHRQTVGDQ
jgi:hypothetical protein